ncbi:MAG: hypothetical protein PVSMB5_06140 [Ktedonobacteraceae bacterium]
MAYNEEISIRHKGIEIRVEKLADNQYDGVFTWNGREIKTDPAYEYATSVQEAIESAKGVIDTLLKLRREGIYVVEDKES